MVPDLEAAKIAVEAMDQKEAKNLNVATEEPTVKASNNEGIESQSHKIGSKTKLCLAIIFLAFFGFMTIFLFAYAAYSDGKNNGIKVAEEYFKNIAMVRAKIEVFGDKDKVIESKHFKIAPSEDSQIENLKDIMEIVWKYEEECKSPKLSDWMGAFYVTNSCLKKLKEKHYIVTDTAIYIQL